MVKYQNSKGECCSFQEGNIKIKETKLHSYSWQPVVYTQKYGATINGFKKDPVEFEIELRISGTDYKKKETTMQLYDIFEYDIESKTPGKLYFDEYYIECYVISSETVPGEYFDVKKIFKVYCPYPFWVKEHTYSFLPQIDKQDTGSTQPIVSGNVYEGDVVENKAVLREFSFDFVRKSDKKIKYPLFDYPFDFVRKTGERVIENSSNFKPCNFKMVIYGYAENPSVIIENHVYQVFATVYEGERLEINSFNKTVVKIGRIGENTNLYNFRNKIQSVFEKIPPGTSRLAWSGGFGIELTLFEERGEPKWNF